MVHRHPLRVGGGGASPTYLCTRAALPAETCQMHPAAARRLVAMPGPTHGCTPSLLPWARLAHLWCRGGGGCQDEARRGDALIRQGQTSTVCSNGWGPASKRPATLTSKERVCSRQMTYPLDIPKTRFRCGCTWYDTSHTSIDTG